MADSDSSSSSITIDESHPFFLHHAENPGAVLVSQPLNLIGGDNYSTWARSMERALSVRGKLGFIDGTAMLTPTMAKFPILVQAWNRCNNIVVIWILNSVSPKIAASMTYRKTAMEVGKTLKDMFSQGNGSRVFQLQKDLASFLQGDLSVSDYFTQLTILWDEIQNFSPFPCCSCGKCTCNVNEKIADLQYRDSVLKLLMGLNESFA